MDDFLVCHGFSFSRDAKWGHGWTAISFFMSAASVLTGGLLWLKANTFYGGLVERIGVGAILFWVFLVSVNLFLEYAIEDILQSKIAKT
ncbi:MAG: hypothetical protein A3F44_02815 [Candidatus Doudnabacteria bacterium RIFCSPHIGHO2_12_FULL_47_25]|nr:MAG: hypothetical protein A3F44_02815 [Candidatus Doudnabacteria bacterium RIFCSPHIGHO2_12_FULL_47_25]